MPKSQVVEPGQMLSFARAEGSHAGKWTSAGFLLLVQQSWSDVLSRPKELMGQNKRIYRSSSCSATILPAKSRL